MNSLSLAEPYIPPGTVRLQCLRLDHDAKLPAKAGPLEAGWDICCIADGDFYTVNDSNQYSDEEKWVGLTYLKEHGLEDEIKVGDKIYFFYTHTSKIFHTGFACAVDELFYMELWDRSGMGAKKNIHRLAGVIDSTYRGEWLVALTNLSNKTHIIKAGDKIVQGIIKQVIPGQAFWVADLPESTRGAAGFGSTGS